MSRLPRGRHFAVTWGIPENYGGMTTALLQRSRAFVRHGRTPVDVLTFDPRPGYDLVEQRLRAAGELTDGVRLLNLYEWLRTNPLPGGSLRHPFTPLPAPDAGVLVQRRLAPDGTVLQTDHYRGDGTLVLSHRRDVRMRGSLGGRSVVLCDERGVPVRSWGRIHHLYSAWLDALTSGPSFMIVDSKTIAEFMRGYRRPHVTTVHVVHNSHLVHGRVRESRASVFADLAAFDAIALLTPRQREDVRAGFGAENLEVVPNPVRPVSRSNGGRDATRGIVLASLTARKRVDHAIRAVASVPGATLDVFGEGPLRAALPSAAGVSLRGHVPGARDSLGSAGFLVATGSSEGFPLALVEAMAAGCIPVAYDVDYGPADLIDGVNGILVRDGDEPALAEAIASLLAESPRQLARRRRHARRTAARFGEAAITRRWALVLRAAAERHSTVLPTVIDVKPSTPFAPLATYT